LNYFSNKLQKGIAKDVLQCNVKKISATKYKASTRDHKGLKGVSIENTIDNLNSELRATKLKLKAHLKRASKKSEDLFYRKV